MLTANLFRALYRRWYVTLLGFLVTLGLMFLAFQVSPLVYLSTTRLVLVPPITKTGENPYMALGGMREITEVLSTSLSDDATVNELKAKGMTGKYSVTRDAAAAGPIVLVTAQGPNGEVAAADRDQVVALVAPRLVSLQDAQRIPRSARITSMVISADEKATAEYKTLIRSLIVAAGFGLVLTAGIAALTDNLLTRRSSRQQQHREVEGTVRAEPAAE